MPGGSRTAGVGRQPQAHAVNRQYGGGSGTWCIGHLAGQPLPLGGGWLCAARPWVEAAPVLGGRAGQPGDVGSGLGAGGRGGGAAAGLQR